MGLQGNALPSGGKEGQIPLFNAVTDISKAAIKLIVKNIITAKFFWLFNIMFLFIRYS